LRSHCGAARCSTGASPRSRPLSRNVRRSALTASPPRSPSLTWPAYARTPEPGQGRRRPWWAATPRRHTRRAWRTWPPRWVTGTGRYLEAAPHLSVPTSPPASSCGTSNVVLARVRSATPLACPTGAAGGSCRTPLRSPAPIPRRRDRTPLSGWTSAPRCRPAKGANYTPFIPVGQSASAGRCSP
jgi:hypothetical protein